MIVQIVLYIAVFLCLGYAASLIRNLVEKKKYAQNWVRIEPEHYIHFSDEQIEGALIDLVEAKGSDAKDLWTSLFSRLRKTYEAQYDDMEHELLRDFSNFDPTSPVSEAMSASKRDLIVNRFLNNWFIMIEKGNYKSLTDKEYQFACSEDFSSTLPVEVQWKALDDTILGSHLKYMDSKYTSSLPDFSNHIWVFHRGTGVARSQDMLIMEKLDVIVTEFFLGIRNIFLRLTGNYVAPIEEKEETNSDAQVIHRITLRASLKKGKSLFQPTLLQEPTFKELVLVYMKKRANPMDPVSFQIKAYRDVPMADLEMLFPENTTTLRPIDIIKFTITLCAGIFSLILNVNSEKSLFDSYSFMSFLVLAAQTGIEYYYSIYYYESLLIQFLHEKSTDSHSGVILQLMHKLKIQEYKEALLAYFFILENGPLTEPELKENAEKFLLNLYTVHKTDIKNVNFEVDDAVEKVIKLGLVNEKTGIYHAIPIDQALSKLK